TTVAGTGEPGFSGDGGPATAARLMNPSALALDAEGNLYIADVGNNRIRRVDRATGIITTVAGSGARGFAGDGGPATAAAFNGLRGLAIGPSGDLFVADFFNQRVRRISADGTITTVAGNGTFNISSEQQLGDGGPASQAVVRWPIDVAVDQAGNLYIAENASHRIRRVTPDGIITTVVGSGSPLFGGFSGDGGPARQARLNLPSGIAVDGSGNLYISDAGNFRVRKVSPR
ncbi:MAG: serine/threonine protein kinase, partial [Acidobacteria bacterium]